MDHHKLRIAISTISFGMIGTVSRFIPLSSYTLVFYRAMLASIIIFLYVIITKKPFRIKVIKENIKLLMIATLGVVSNWLFMFMAFNTCSVPVATVSINTLPIFILIMAAIVFGEKMSIKTIICIIISTIGIILISNVLYTGFRSKEILGVMYGILTAILTGVVVMANKKLEKVNAYEKIVFEFFISGLIILPIALIKGESFLFTTNDNLIRSIIMFLFLSIYITGVVYILYFGSLDKISSKSIAFITYFDPITSLTLSYIVLNEKLEGFQILGAILIFLAIIINEMITSKKELPFGLRIRKK